MANELIKALTNGQWVLSKADEGGKHKYMPADPSAPAGQAPSATPVKGGYYPQATSKLRQLKATQPQVSKPAEKEELERLKPVQEKMMQQRTAASDVTRGTPEQIEQWRTANKKIMETHPNEADRRDASLRFKHNLPPKEIHNALMSEAAKYKAKDFKDKYRSNAPAGVDMTRKQHSPLVHYSANVEDAMKENLRRQGVADRDIDDIVRDIRQQMRPQQAQPKAPVKAITRVQGSPGEVRVTREQQQAPAQVIQRKRPGQELQEVPVEAYTPKISGIYQSPYAPRNSARQESSDPVSPMALQTGQQKLQQLMGDSKKGSSVKDNRDVSHLQKPPMGSYISQDEWQSMPMEHRDLIHRSHAKPDLSKKPEGSVLSDEDWDALPMQMKAIVHQSHKK